MRSPSSPSNSAHTYFPSSYSPRTQGFYAGIGLGLLSLALLHSKIVFSPNSSIGTPVLPTIFVVSIPLSSSTYSRTKSRSLPDNISVSNPVKQFINSRFLSTIQRRDIILEASRRSKVTLPLQDVRLAPSSFTTRYRSEVSS